MFVLQAIGLRVGDGRADEPAWVPTFEELTDLRFQMFREDREATEDGEATASRFRHARDRFELEHGRISQGWWSTSTPAGIALTFPKIGADEECGRRTERCADSPCDRLGDARFPGGGGGAARGGRARCQVWRDTARDCAAHCPDAYLGFGSVAPERARIARRSGPGATTSRTRFASLVTGCA